MRITSKSIFIFMNSKQECAVKKKTKTSKKYIDVSDFLHYSQL